MYLQHEFQQKYPQEQQSRRQPKRIVILHLGGSQPDYVSLTYRELKLLKEEYDVERQKLDRHWKRETKKRKAFGLKVSEQEKQKALNELNTSLDWKYRAKCEYEKAAEQWYQSEELKHKEENMKKLRDLLDEMSKRYEQRIQMRELGIQLLKIKKKKQQQQLMREKLRQKK
ncbi:MAG: hypothetical protein EZS28_031078, partial [Streblomastix strix]